MSHPLPTTVVSLSALAAAFLTALALLAYQRRRDPRLLWVAGAFLLFLGKALLTVWDLQSGTLGHERLEMVASVLDLAILALLIVPLLRQR